MSPRSSPTRISSRSASDNRAGDGSHAVGGAASRINAFLAPPHEHSTNRPISRSEWPAAASRRTSRSWHTVNLLGTRNLLDQLNQQWSAHRAIARIP